MKKLSILLALVAVATMASLAFKTATPAPPSYSPFKTVSTDTSGSNRVATINCNYFNDGDYYIEMADSVTLTINKVKNGGDYRLLLKKTVAGVCTLTTTASVVGTTSPISISGSTNTYYWVDFTSNGTVTVLHKR